MKPVFTIKAHLDGGHDMASVELAILATTHAAAIDAFHRAMTQLGFKRSDYGYLHVRGMA